MSGSRPPCRSATTSPAPPASTNWRDAPSSSDGPRGTSASSTRTRCHQASAVGGEPAFAPVEDDAGLEDQVLDDEVLVSLEDGPVGDVGQGDDGLLGDGRLGGLGAILGAGALPRALLCRPFRARMMIPPRNP